MSKLDQTILVYLQGQIERITYTNDENGYTIAKLKVYDQKDLVTVVGTLVALTAGEIIKMKGQGVNHQTYPFTNHKVTTLNERTIR